MKIHQGAELTRDPIADLEAATKRYVDMQISTGASSTVTGGLFFTNVTPSGAGIVGSKSYVSNTTPSNAVITEATTDTDNVTVTLHAEGGSSFFSPTVTVTTNPPQPGGPITASLAVQQAGDRRYTATANLTGITTDTVVTATSSTNATATLTIRRAVAGPVVSSIAISGLPGSQTEAKSGDTVQVTGVVANAATYMEIIPGGASASTYALSLGPVDSGGAGFKAVAGTFIASGASGAQVITARASNSLGTYGVSKASSNSVMMNQTFPSIGARTITYPATQNGLKGSESASIASTVTNFDTILYSGTNLSIANPTTYSATKTATLTGGTYSWNVNNYTITATKASNGAVSTAQSAVTIAAVAPTAAITYTPAGRMASTSAGVNHVVTITANQRLNVAPSVAASSGTWLGSWTGSGTTWTRTLQVKDTDPKGPQTFSDLSVTGLANLVGTTITSGASYTVGGFATRTITFAPFARYAPIGTNVVDITKVTSRYTGGTTLARQTNTDNVFQGFTIVNSSGNYDPNGDHLFISDADYAGANTSGTLQLDVTEAA